MMILRALLLAILLSVPGGAFAHIIFAEPTAKAASYYAGFLRVTHGCGDSATTSIRVEIPAGIDVARPQPKAGWTLSIERTRLAQPITSESGAAITSRVSAVTWVGNLPADEFDQFGIMLKLPAAAGSLYFPTTQRCAVGSNLWVNVPPSPDAWHATKMPAPMLVVTNGTGSDGMSDMRH